MNLKNIKKYTPGFNIHDIQKKYKLKKVIKLASNENPFISKDVLSFIKKSNHKLNLYPDSNPDELHKLLADTVGHRMTRNNIILGNGSNEILEFIVRANIDNKSEVIIPKHSFLVYEIISKLQNAKIITTKPDNDKSSENYLGINLESVIEKITNKSIRDINAVEKMSKKKKPSKHENKRFIRTDKLITSKASHNIKRLKWVAEAGSEGRSYSELNRKDSIYRQNIKRKTYKGNESLITQDISYDIKQGMIKEK